MHILIGWYLQSITVSRVLAESGEPATSTFSVDIDSQLRLIFMIVVDKILVPCTFEMCNAGFFLFDSLFSELTWYCRQSDLE